MFPSLRREGQHPSLCWALHSMTKLERGHQGCHRSSRIPALPASATALWGSNPAPRPWLEFGAFWHIPLSVGLSKLQPSPPLLQAGNGAWHLPCSPCRSGIPCGNAASELLSSSMVAGICETAGPSQFNCACGQLSTFFRHLGIGMPWWEEQLFPAAQLDPRKPPPARSTSMEAAPLPSRSIPALPFLQATRGPWIIPCLFPTNTWNTPRLGKKCLPCALIYICFNCFLIVSQLTWKDQDSGSSRPWNGEEEQDPRLHPLLILSPCPHGSRRGSLISPMPASEEEIPPPFLLPCCFASLTSFPLPSVSLIFLPFFFPLTLVLLPREKCFEKEIGNWHTPIISASKPLNEVGR